MEFTYQQNRDWNCAARRSVVMSRNGMVASSQNLASLTGYKILARGGNAIDAAVGMLCTLSVVEPHSVGIGGDAFAIIYSSKDDHLYGMNASGRAPSKANVSWFLQQGFAKVPEDGILSVTIPGALDGWIKAVERFGKLTISEIFEDAIYYAENGFPVTEIISGEWQASESKIKSDRYLNQIYTVNGRIAQPGDVIRNPDLAKTYKLIVDNGSEIFYQGIIAKAIVNFSASKNGLIEMEDLHNHRTTWVDPISFNYRGYEVWELPPNTQGITALEILNILEGYDLNSFGFTSAEYYHLLIEAKKIAFQTRDSLVTDPLFYEVPIDTILSKQYGDECRKRINIEKISTQKINLLNRTVPHTVYVSVVDKERNAVSFISSIFEHFGSGLTVDGTGIILQNRGSGFSIDPTHPNRIEGNKRTMHTLIPGMITQTGKCKLSFGIMGGDMQSQGHVQFIINLLDRRMNIQEAMDAPRVRHIQGNDVLIEKGIAKDILEGLTKKGHNIIETIPPINKFGGGQAIFIDDESGVLLGASDRRKDGCAIGY